MAAWSTVCVRNVALCSTISTQLPGVALRPLRGSPLRSQLVMAGRWDGAMEGMEDEVFAVAADVYLRSLDRNPYSREWWRRNPEAHPEITV